jgi:hypothetical protein
MDQPALKRGRGRPRGAGKPDGPALRSIADLMVAEPDLKWTTAIKRTIGSQNPSAIRRLQVKVKEDGATLLEEARQRRESRRLAAQRPIDLGQALGMNPEMRTTL